MAASDQPDRPLRRDAERNRLRILTAAREVFAVRGIDVTLDDIAHHAGLGVGTVYRRYPSREHLVEALFDEELDRIVGWAEEGLGHPDPWVGLTDFLERATAGTADRGLRDVLFSRAYGQNRVAEARERIAPVVDALVVRCQQAGVVRPDVAGADVALLHFMAAALLEYTDHAEPGLWRRYLALVVDGLRGTSTTLPLVPPSADALGRIAAEWKPPRRPSPE